MADDISDILTPQHYEAFGRITTAYAHIEFGIKYALSAAIDAYPYEVMILTDPCSALTLRNVAKSIAKTNLKPAIAEKFVWFIGEHKAFGPLRNSIAHHDWTTGTQPGSVRPVYMDIRSGRPIPRGYGDDEFDEEITLGDLIAQADKLFHIAEQFRQFLVSSGIAEAIEAKMERTKPETEFSLGISATES